MNQAEVSGFLCVSMHEMDGGEEPFAAECSKMNQDTSHETTKFDVEMATSAMYSDHGNTNACLDEYHISGIQHLEEIRFDSTQHIEFQSEGVVADSEEESLSSGPETSSGCMEQKYIQQVYNEFDTVVDKGRVMFSPDFIMYDGASHAQPHITFSSDGFNIEFSVLDSHEMAALHWDISDIISINCKWFQNVVFALITFLAGPEAEIRNSGPIKVQFYLEDPQWLRKQQRIWHLSARYQEIWNDVPSDDFASENWSIKPSLFFPRRYFLSTEDFEEVIYPRGDPDAVSISKRDVELLLPETFVNDTIIDFYVKYLSTRIEPTEKRRYHFFNSFFFRKLADLDKDQGRAPEGRAAFLRVRKWTRKINVFEKDFLFIPVNFNLHWSLIVICYPGLVATFEDGDVEGSDKVPCILHMDSLKGSHNGLKDIIQSYLWEEWTERHPESASDNSDKFLNLRFVSLELPQQDNSFDCGLFLLHYVELFLMDAPSSFNIFKINVSDFFLSDDWFPPAEASLKRSVIRKLIHEAVTGSIQDHPMLVFSNEQLDKGCQRSKNVDQEPAAEFLAQRCSAGEPDSVCTIHDDTHSTQQLSTSVCLNDSEENRLPASGCNLDTGRVSMVALQNLKEFAVVSQDKDSVVCLSSQDERNNALLTESSNHLDMRLCGMEDSEVLKGRCFVKDKYTHEESLLVSSENNQKNCSQTEGEVHDFMVSKCCLISDDAEEIMASQDQSLERNTDDVGVECHKASQDMDSVMMPDGCKDNTGLHPERTARGVEDGHDLCEDMDPVVLADINRDVAEHSLERSAVGVEDTKLEHDLVDPIAVKDGIKDDTKEVSATVVDSVMIPDGCKDNTGLHPERTTRGVEDGHGLCEDMDPVVLADINRDVAEHSLAVRVEDTKLEHDLVDPIAVKDGIKDDTKEVSATVDNVNQTELNELKVGNIGNCIVGDTCDLKVGNSDDGMTGGSTVSSESKEEKTDIGMAGDSCELKLGDTDHSMSGGSTVSSELKEGSTDHVMAGDCTDETKVNAGGEDTCDNGAVTCEDDTTCTDAKMPLVDRPCSTENETISENTTCDTKRPLLDGACEAKDISASDNKCAQKVDAQGIEAKIERHYKRRKVLAAELEKQHTRSS